MFTKSHEYIFHRCCDFVFMKVELVHLYDCLNAFLLQTYTRTHINSIRFDIFRQTDNYSIKYSVCAFLVRTSKHHLPTPAIINCFWVKRVWMDAEKQRQDQKKINNKFWFIKRTNLYNYMADDNNHFRDSFHSILQARLNEFTRATEHQQYYLHEYLNKVNEQWFFAEAHVSHSYYNHHIR